MISGEKIRAAARHARGFRGWRVLGGLFCIYGMSNGISNTIMPLLYPYLMEEFGWTQAEVTYPAAIKFLFASLYNLGVGFLLSRYSPRPIMATGALIMLGGLAGMLFMAELWHFLVVFLLVAFGLSMCGLIPCMVTVSRWFVKHRGLAVGILLTASSAAGGLLPLMIDTTLDESGWRAALLMVVAVGFATMFLPVLWPVRARPEDVGQVPDGLENSAGGEAEPAQQAESSGSGAGIAGNVPLAQVARMPIFYLLLIATAILWFCITGVLQHQAIYLKESAALGDKLEQVVSALFFSSIFGKFIFGFLSDRFSKSSIMLAATLNLTIALLIFRFVEHAPLGAIFAYAVVMGVGFAGAFVSIQTMIARLFAGSTYSRILGIFIAVDNIAAAAGAFALGQIRVSSGSYAPAIELMIGLAAAAFACVLLVKRISARLRVE